MNCNLLEGSGMLFDRPTLAVFLEMTKQKFMPSFNLYDHANVRGNGHQWKTHVPLDISAKFKLSRLETTFPKLLALSMSNTLISNHILSLIVLLLGIFTLASMRPMSTLPMANILLVSYRKANGCLLFWLTRTGEARLMLVLRL